MFRLPPVLLALAGTGSATPAGSAPAAAPAKAAAAPAASPTAAPSPDTVVAKWNGGQITYGQLGPELKGQLIRMEVEYLTQRYQAESGAADQALVEALIEAEAKARGFANAEALLKADIEDKVAEPTEAEMEQFYAMMQRQLRGMPYEEAKPMVRQELMRRKKGELFTTWMEGLKGRMGAEVLVAYPDLPRIQVSVDDDPSMGPADAPVTIVQFAEYQCPYCGKARAALDEVMAAYPGKIRMVFRDYPLSFHPRAVPAAVAANCAGKQGKYWEMHDLLMKDQQRLEDADLTAHATALALDLAAWNTCRQDPTEAAEVQKDFEDGNAAGVSGTPAFFINGVMLSGAQPASEFKRVIDRDLAAR